MRLRGHHRGMATKRPKPPAEEAHGEETTGEQAAGEHAAAAPDPDSTATPPPPPPVTEPAPEATEPRFFRWIRSLGLVRGAGWLGGVCVAIAARTRIDPILVRGIVVVLAVLGAPVVLLYAAAWFLLPDEKGQIHALRLGRGRVEGPTIAIAALVLLSFLPLTQGFWWAGAAYWGDPDVVASVGRVLWTALVIAVAIVVVVFLARRAVHPDITTVPATTDDRPETVPRPAEFAAAPAEVVAPAAEGAPAPLEPPAPPVGAGDAELAAWKHQQQAWQRQRAEWAAQQRAEDRARRAAAHAAWVQERDARLAEHRRREPWVGGPVIGIVLGLAVVVGSAVGLLVGVAHPERAIGWTAGLGAAVVVFGLALAVAGLFRRRAGALAAFAILALVGAIATMPLVANRTPILALGGGYGIDTMSSGRYARLLGTTEFAVYGIDGTAPPTRRIDLWQRAGTVQVRVAPEETVRVIATIDHGSLRTGTWQDGSPTEDATVTPDARRHGSDYYDITYGTGRPDVVLRVTLVSGTLQLASDPQLNVSQPGDAPTATPTPSSTFSEGVQP
jgi:phage shock protein PspC (stress-responsive transcriptional regulator)